MKVSAKQDQIKATDEQIYQLISNPENLQNFTGTIRTKRVYSRFLQVHHSRNGHINIANFRKNSFLQSIIFR
jgi:hypothetical protein